MVRRDGVEPPKPKRHVYSVLISPMIMSTQGDYSVVNELGGAVGSRTLANGFGDRYASVTPRPPRTY